MTINTERFLILSGDLRTRLRLIVGILTIAILTASLQAQTASQDQSANLQPNKGITVTISGYVRDMACLMKFNGALKTNQRLCLDVCSRWFAVGNRYEKRDYLHPDVIGEASYLAATGDRDFLNSHWASIEAAYRYCVSTLNAKDGLPRISAGKEGGNEQESLSDDLRLSVSWVDASESFARLAALLGKTHLAEDALRMNQQARRSIAKRYWSDSGNAWISATTRQGEPIIDRREVPASVFQQGVFTEAQRGEMLDSLASSAFQTDWGTRGIPSDSSKYDPNSYASGSVWAARTAGTSETYWKQHRPATAWPIWNALVPWASLDAIGRMHEALAGNFYHEEEESVPEQMWSSAQFITAAVRGMLGIDVNAEKKQITFSPHLPAAWGKLTLRNVRAGGSFAPV